jgi:pentatricopeptide repeat protein
VLEAMLQLGRIDQVHATLTWLLRVVESTAPQLAPFYGIDGSPHASQDELDAEGYRGSEPVRIGNNAGDQLQLGNYGDLLQAVRMFVEDGNSVGPGAARMLGGTLDFLPRVWRNPDSSIWELPDRRQYLQGKLAAWMAFDCGLRLHERGEVEGSPGSWRAERDEVERFIEERCWSDERGAYVFHADTRGLDASSLLMARTRYLDGHEERFAATVRAVREELGAGGALLHRYSGMRSEEGAFVACSFWLIEALARLGRRDEAAELMDDMVGRGNDLGLFSEEIDPEGGELLGNVPQALSHLALVNAAFALEAS